MSHTLHVIGEIVMLPIGVYLLIVATRKSLSNGWRCNGVTAIAGVVLVVVGALALFDLVRSP